MFLTSQKVNEETSYHNLLSSSTIVTVASPILPTETLVGSEDALILSVKFSLYSDISSSFIVMLNLVYVSPARIVTVYGPGE